MPKASTRFDLSQFPEHVLDLHEDIDQDINTIIERANGYHAQVFCLRVLKDLRQMKGPDIGFEIDIDTEEGIHFLYCNGENFEYDVDAFESDEDEAEWVRERAQHLEGFAQFLNDYASGIQEFAQGLVEHMNKHQWSKDAWEDSIAQALTDDGQDGHRFVAALSAKELEASAPKARSRKMRRSGL